jgi:RNA recognition motif-containing protein
MSWTQVYVTGLSRTVDPTDEKLEELLDKRYGLTAADPHVVLWAGPGTTLVKREDDTGVCRGYAFLAFYSDEGAAIAVDRINSKSEIGDESSGLPPQLVAELSKPKNRKQKKKPQDRDSSENLPDTRLRRKRRAPVRKHPVIISSDRTKTGLGNKTR